MPPLSESRIHVRIAPAKKKRFVAKCNREQLVPADVVRRMIKDFVEGRITYTQPEIKIND